MEIVDLKPEHHASYFRCLEDWSDEMKEAGDHKERWYHTRCSRGLRGKLAVDDDGTPGGMIQYLPIEQTLLQGRGLYFINCVWVHGYKEGRGNFQKRGMGRALLSAAEADARSLGAEGMAAWGLWIPVWMRASWFRKHDYRKADRDGFMLLLYKPFVTDLELPRLVRPRKKPKTVPGKVAVTAFVNGWCPGRNIAYERIRQVAGEFGDQIVLETIDTSNVETAREWGLEDALYVDGKPVNFGPPPSREKFRKLLGKRVKRLT